MIRKPTTRPEELKESKDDCSIVRSDDGFYSLQTVLVAAPGLRFQYYCRTIGISSRPRE